MLKQNTLELNQSKDRFISISNEEINHRWNNLKRLYSPKDVRKLQGTVKIEYSLAKIGAEKLCKWWKKYNNSDFRSDDGGWETGHRNLRKFLQTSFYRHSYRDLPLLFQQCELQFRLRWA